LLSPAGVPSLPGPAPLSSCSCRVHHLLPSVPCSHRQPDAGIPPACGDGQARMGLTSVSLSSKLSQVDSVRNRGFVSRVGSETGLRAPTGRSSCRVQLRNGPGITSRSSRNQDQVVARSPDLATWPTEGLQPQARRETYGPADGGVWRPAPNRQLEIRKLFPARS